MDSIAPVSLARLSQWEALAADQEPCPLLEHPWLITPFATHHTKAGTVLRKQRKGGRTLDEASLRARACPWGPKA